MINSIKKNWLEENFSAHICNRILPCAGAILIAGFAFAGGYVAGEKNLAESTAMWSNQIANQKLKVSRMQDQVNQANKRIVALTDMIKRFGTVMGSLSHARQGEGGLQNRNVSLLEIDDAGVFSLPRKRGATGNESTDTLIHMKIYAEYSPAGWPTEGRLITSAFGYRTDPFTGNIRFHKGMDIDGETGDTIRAVAPGVVTFSGKMGSYGGMVEVSHLFGYKTRYAHTSSNLVKAGDYVERGQEIARIGRTGRATGSVLHFEILANGRQIDPMPFVGR